MRFSQINKVIGALGLIIVLVLAGCIACVLAAPTTPSTGPSGELRVAVSTFGVETFDPTITGRTALANYLLPMYDYLIRTDPPLKGVNTGVAERWEMAPDGLSWIFYIRKGIKFHNGDDLTAKDVKFSLERYTSKNALNAFIRDTQERVEVVDDYTVRVYTKGVQPYYWRNVNFVPGYQGLILPQNYIEKNGLEYFKRHPIGTGPFKLVRYVAGDMVEYEAVGQHFRQVPAFKKITIILVAEEKTRAAMLKTGEVDLIEIGVDSAPELEGVGLRTAILGGNQASTCFFGSYDPRAKGLPIADKRVREALSLAVNREEIGRTLFYGKMQPPMPPGGLWYDQPEIDVRYWRDYSAKFYRYDPEEAKRLLKEAGYAKGFTLKYYSTVEGGAPYLPKLNEVIQGYWLKIGVKAEIVPVEWGVFKTMWRSGPNRGPVDALVGNVCGHGADGNPIAVTALQSGFSSMGVWGFAAGEELGQNAELERLLVAIPKEPDETKRFGMTARLIQLAMDTRVYDVIGTVPTMAGLGGKVDINFPPGLVGIAMQVEAAKHRKK